MKLNDAENEVEVNILGRFYNGKKLTPAQMLWKCATEGCTTSKKIQRRKQYENKMLCNACSNRAKNLVPGFLENRGKTISAGIKKEKRGARSARSLTLWENPEYADKVTSGVRAAYENMSSEQKEFFVKHGHAVLLDLNHEFNTRIKVTAFWKNLRNDPINRARFLEARVSTYRQTAENRHINMMSERHPGFHLLHYSTAGSNLYICPAGHQFNQLGSNFLKRGSCPTCSPRSAPELEILAFLQTLDPSAQSNKKVLYYSDERSGNAAYEIDAYSKLLNLGVEHHGLYYHAAHDEAETPKEQKARRSIDRNKHKFKADIAEKEGITLLQFFEDEWLHQQEIVKSMIQAKAGTLTSTIYARKTELRQVSSQESAVFFDSTHIQGSCQVRITFGLYHENELVSAVSLRSPTQASTYEGHIEIARFSSKLNTSVVGGFQKLLAAVETWARSQRYSHVLTYADRRFSIGGVYASSGFVKKDKTTDGDWWYLNSACTERIPRQAAQKSKEDYKNHRKIYGAGSYIFTKKL